MLMLTRRVGESILIGKDILITITELHGRQVRIGISAPKDMPVSRTELLDDLPDAPALAALLRGR